MNKNQKILVVIIIIIGIIISIILYFTIFKFKHIEDKNGDITNLVSINFSDKKIINNAKNREDFTSYTYDGNKSGITNEFKNLDYDYIKFQAKRLSGVKVVQATKVEENQKLIIEIDSELKSGNLEIIVLAPNNIVIENIQVNSTRQVIINNTIEGIYKVVIGGESANYKVEINRTIIN
jgi:uncharacterized protein YxeA